MALGPQRSDELTPEQLEQCRGIEESIDAALESQRGEEDVELEVSTEKRLSAAQIEYLQDRYTEAGWSLCSLRQSRPVFGAVNYAVDLRR